MSSIPDGVYRITKPNDQAATIFTGIPPPPGPKSRVFVLPITTGQEQNWMVTNLSDGNVTIQSVVTGQYLGFLGEPLSGTPCEQTPDPVEWRLQQSAEQGKFHVVVPGGPVGGTELAFDISPLTIFPPLTALGELHVEDVQQAWGFKVIN